MCMFFALTAESHVLIASNPNHSAAAGSALIHLPADRAASSDMLLAWYCSMPSQRTSPMCTEEVMVSPLRIGAGEKHLLSACRPVAPQRGCCSKGERFRFMALTADAYQGCRGWTDYDLLNE